MSKKKKKDGFIDFVEIGIKLVKSGNAKLKLKNGVTIKMDELSKESIDNTIGSRYEAMVDNSEVSSSDENILSIGGQWCDQLHTFRMMDKLRDETSSKPLTLVYVVNRKSVGKIFNFCGNTLIAQLLRCSNLGVIFKAINKQWDELLKKSKTSDCILFIPEICIFGDEKLGTVTTKYQKVNLLIYTTKEKEEENIFDVGDDENGEKEKEPDTVAERVLEIAVKLGLKNLIIDPLSLKDYAKDVENASVEWHSAMEKERIQKRIELITFTINNDDDFIIFWKSKHPDSV